MKKKAQLRVDRQCPQCGELTYREAMLPDQVGKGMHEADYCTACGYEDAVGSNSVDEDACKYE